MNINRHNYEEYFILYMDNELGSDERRQVEDFIQKHPDLKEELDVLLQYKMVADTSIIFDGKEELMIHNGYSPISIANYEEWLTIYVDNELTSNQRNEVEQFVAANPQVKKELEILQQTKLHPEEIIFKNKELLYRREEKVRAIPMRWWRAGAAAVLILAIGLTTVVVLNKKSSNIGIVKAPNKEQKANKENPVVIKQENNPSIQPIKASQQIIIKNPRQKTNVIAKRSNTAEKKLPVNAPVPVKKEEPIIAKNNEKPSNNLPQPLNNNVISDPTKTDIAVNTPQGKNNPKISLTDGPVTTDSPQPSNVVYNDLNQSDGKKSKLRGFLRKVTRTFEKNTNINATDDDRVLIGGLALKLK